MLSVEIRLLSGTYTATAFNDRQRPEWPIHPWRLFAALVATWAEAGADASEREALTWLESQPPPAVAAAAPVATATRAVVTHYVPGNDPAVGRDVHGLADAITAAERAARSAPQGAKAHAALAKARQRAAAATATQAQPRAVSQQVLQDTLRLLPEERNKQARYYPTVRPDQPAVWMTWASAPPAPLASELDRMLARVGRIGHSSTLVSCRLADPPPGMTSFVPVETGARAAGSMRLRVPTANLLDELEAEYARHRGMEPRNLPALFTRYRAADEADAPAVLPAEAGDWIVFGFADKANRGVSNTLALTRTLRSSVLSHSAEPLDPVLSGHDLDGPTRLPHVMWLALPNVGSPHSDGRVMGLAMALPASLTDSQRTQVVAAVRAFEDAGATLSWRDRTIALTPSSVSAATLDRWEGGARSSDRAFWVGPSSVWTSATPIALDRYPRVLRRRDAGRTDDLSAEISYGVGVACQRVGLPAPEAVDLVIGSPLVGIPPVGGGSGRQRFPAYRANSSQTRYAVHVTIRFDRPVHGPLVLGAGRYFGYGLMFPVLREGRGRR